MYGLNINPATRPGDTTTADFRGVVTELLALAQHSDTTLGDLVADISGDEDGDPQDTASPRTITEVRQVQAANAVRTLVTLDNGNVFSVTVQRV